MLDDPNGFNDDPRTMRERDPHLLLFASMEPEPGNCEPSSAWPVPSDLADCPQKSLWKIEAIGSKIGLHMLMYQQQELIYMYKTVRLKSPKHSDNNRITRRKDIL